MKQMPFILVWFLVSAAAWSQVPVVNSLSNLLALPVASGNRTQRAVDVLGVNGPSDGMPTMRWVWDGTNTWSTNQAYAGRIVRASTFLTNGAPGRWLLPWNGDPRAFGAFPYQARHTAVPWGYKGTIPAIGTGPFSVYIRTTFPTNYLQAASLFALNRVALTNVTTELSSGVSHRASPDIWGFLFRSTNGSSSVGIATDDAATIDTTPSAIAAYGGQTVDVVLTRSGTTVKIYFNGTDVTALFSVSNPNGWAKALALGETVSALVSCNENSWYWPRPIQRFAVWASALNVSQVANPWAVSAKLVEFVPDSVEEPVDCTAAFNAAGAFAEAMGGGEIRLPPGGYRVDGEIKLRQNVTWRGSGSSPYPAAYRTGFIPATCWIAPWFGATNRVFVGDQSQSSDMFLYPRELVTLGNGVVSSRALRASVSDLVLFGAFARSSDGVVLDRVGSVRLENLGFWFLPGFPINGIACNSLQILNCEGPANKGFHLRATSDSIIEGNFIDGVKGPALWLAGNRNRVIGNVFELAGNPFAGYPPYAWAATANASTDTISIAHTAGHRLRTGHPVRFTLAGGAVLPTPLTTNVDYYVIALSDAAIKVATNYVDEIGSGGAVNGGGIVDLTSAGSGTWYLTPGPSVGMLLAGDHNIVVANQSQRNWDAGVIVEGGFNGTFADNSIITSGDGVNLTAPAFMIVASPRNTFSANQVDDREQSGQSQYGFVADAASVDNLFVGNSVNVDIPYTFGSPGRQVVIDAKQAIFPWGGSAGSLYVPSRAGFTAWDPVDFTDAAATVYDRSARRWYVSSGTTANAADWHYGVTYPFAGPIYWSSSTAGLLSGVNNGSAATMLSLNGTAGNPLVYVQVNDSTSLTAGPSVGMYRNFAPNSTTYGAVQPFTRLGRIVFGGWVTNDVAGSRNAASLEAYSDLTQWNSTNAHSRLDLSIVQPASTAAQTVFTLAFPTANVAGDTALLISTADGTTYSPSTNRVKVGPPGSGAIGGTSKGLYID